MAKRDGRCPDERVRRLRTRLLRRSLLPGFLLAVAATFLTEGSISLASGGVVLNGVTFTGTSTVGALFTTAGGKLLDHFCTGSVIQSPEGDLVITAAHCLVGMTPKMVAFVPDYRNGRAPDGVWSATAIFVDTSWAKSDDPDDDFAFLTVKHSGTRSIQSVTGAEKLGTAASSKQLVEAIGYPDSSNAPISCENVASSFSPTQLVFDCGGYSVGTSGGPLLVPARGAPTVIGVIGGYQQGGDTSAVSYAAKFRSNLTALYATATTAAAKAATPAVTKAATPAVTKTVATVATKAATTTATTVATKTVTTSPRTAQAATKDPEASGVLRATTSPGRSSPHESGATVRSQATSEDLVRAIVHFAFDASWPSTVIAIAKRVLTSVAG